MSASDADAYSSYWTFAANRAHFTGQTCLATSNCQIGKTCTAGSRLRVTLQACEARRDRPL